MNLLNSLGGPGLAAGLLLLAGGVLTAAAQSKAASLTITPDSDTTLSAPVKNAHGKVISIVGRELTLDVDGRYTTFVVDENTDVLARGAGRATRAAGGSLPITALVHTGDVARVSYRELRGSMRVSEIHIKGRSTIAAR